MGWGFEAEFFTLISRTVSSPEINGRFVAALSLPLKIKLLFRIGAEGKL